MGGVVDLSPSILTLLLLLVGRTAGLVAAGVCAVRLKTTSVARFVGR